MATGPGLISKPSAIRLAGLILRSPTSVPGPTSRPFTVGPTGPVGDDPPSIERTAVHEAGHVVMARAVGLTVWSVMIGTAGGGATTLSRLSRDLSPHDDILWRLAGPAAESLAFGAFDAQGARSDRVHADLSAFDLTGDVDATDELVDACWPDVRDLLSDHWAAVEGVALSLLDGSGTIQGEQLRVLIAGAPVAQVDAARLHRERRPGGGCPGRRSVDEMWSLP